MRDRLRAVDDDLGAVAMRDVDDLLDRNDGAERVRNLRHRDDPGAIGQQLLELVEPHLAGVVDRNHAQLRALFGAQHLPGHDVGMMFQVRDHDLVAFAHVLLAVGLGDQVDAFGGAAHEDDFFGLRCPDELGDLLARAFVGIGRASGEFVRGAVDVRVLVLVEVREPLDHRARLLRRRRVIEPDQLILSAVDARGEDREIAADRIHVERAAALRNRWRRVRARRAQIGEVIARSGRQRCGGRTVFRIRDRSARQARSGQ